MTSCNSKILTIQHLRRVVPKLGFCFFTTKKASSGKQGDLRKMLKKGSKKVCSKIAAPSHKPLVTHSFNSSATKTQENIEENYDNLEQADGGIITEHSNNLDNLACVCSCVSLIKGILLHVLSPMLLLA